jgi:hypothetical protein
MTLALLCYKVYSFIISWFITFLGPNFVTISKLFSNSINFFFYWYVIILMRTVVIINNIMTLLFSYPACWMGTEERVVAWRMALFGMFCLIPTFSLSLMPDQPSWLAFYMFWKVCGASDTQELPPNFIKLAKDAYTPDLMAASDCMLGNEILCPLVFKITYYLSFLPLAWHIQKFYLFQCRENWIWHREWGFGLQAAICICSKRLFQWRTIFAEYARGWNILGPTLC